MRPASLRALLLISPFLTTACDRPGDTGRTPPPGAAPSNSNVGAGPSREGVPTFEYGGTGGCSHFLMYRADADRTEVFVVSAEMDRLGIKPGTTTFDLAKAPKELSVTVEMFPRPQRHLHLCTDYLDPESDKPVIWAAVRGKMTVERFPADPRPEGGIPTFRVKVTVERSAFQDPFGHKVECPRAIVLDSTVGWVPG